MAIVKMKRLSLLALNADREKIYDALVKCGNVQLKRSADIDSFADTDSSVAREKVMEDVSRVEEAIGYVTEMTDRHNSAHKHDKTARVTVPKNSFARPKTEVDYDYLLNFETHVPELELSLSQVAALKDGLSAIAAQRAQKQAEWQSLQLFKDLPHPTSWYRDTANTVVRLSQLNTSDVANLQKLVSEFETVTVETVGEYLNSTLVVAVAHNSERSFFERATALGLTKCSVSTDVLPAVQIEALERQIAGIDNQISQDTAAVAAYADRIPMWKIYVDWLLLKEKKLAADGDVVQSTSTFVLEAFCPADKEQLVSDTLNSVTDCAVVCFYEIGDDEFAPTLTRNNKFVTPFETVTDSYSVSDYHEVDPNPVMSAFYFVIFGLMVADIGYGVLLAALGLAVTFLIKQNTGLKLMLQMFGICGVSAVVIGLLFGSVFGYTVYNGVIPNPAEYPMVMMILSLLFGVVHIAAGVGCKMAVKIKHKQYLSAWLADFPWIIVFASFVTAIFNSALDMADYDPYQALRLPNIVSQIALYVCLAALAVALVCAGLGTKGFLGKVIKSFGSAYGIINYFSDVMSYIRVFGLMLSSAIMASTVNTLGSMVASGGGFGYVLAAIILVFAHLFNLVMGLLSVYIHNGRLQYVEFFGKFYTGDGKMFVPFGSDTRYTLLVHKDSIPNGGSAVK